MKKSKTISTIMAASVVAGSVIPSFASEVQTISNVVMEKSSVEAGQISTKVIDARSAYGEALTKDEEGNIVKETIEESKAKLAKMVFDEIVAELEAKAAELYQTIEDGKIVEKPRYTIELDTERSVFKYSVTEDGRVVDNQIYVTATNNETNKTTTYIFVGVKGYDVDHGFGQDLPLEDNFKVVDLSNIEDYTTMSTLHYELVKNADKIVVEQEKVTHEDDYTAYDLVLTINLKDGTKIGEITIENVQAFNEDEYVTLPVGGDIDGHWGEEYVRGAMLDKWVDASAKFRPNDAITRAEFVKVVNRAFGINADDMSLTKNFSDVSDTEWYYQDIKAAARIGYIEGYTDGTFRPNQPITRQEAAKIIAKLHANIDLGEGEEMEDVEIVLPDVNGNDVEKDTKTSFADDSSIAVWADESVQYLKDAQIIEGYSDNTYKPGSDIKRAEAITMLYRAVK